MTVLILTGPQGGGKSRAMRETAIANPGLYLFALPTRELIDEQVADFVRASPALHTEKVYSESCRGRTGERLTAACMDFGQRHRHAVLFTTHETLKAHDLAGFAGWHVCIDEVPHAVQAGRHHIGLTARAWLSQTFSLGGGQGYEWSNLKLNNQKPNWKAIERDKGARDFAEIFKQADIEQRVFVRTDSWMNMEEVEWFTMWTPLELSHFSSVTVAGSGYTESIGFKATKALFGAEFGVAIQEIREPRTAQPPIYIHYFTAGHEGTTTYWDTSEGRLNIKKVCDHLGQHLSATSYWSGNGVVQKLMEHRIAGTMIKPMAAGLNKHRASQDCALIFSAKATRDDEPIKEVFGLTDDDIRHAREDDAIAQFAMRGAIRDPSFGDPYNIYLYSFSQAERLRSHLSKIGFTSVELVAVDQAGIMDVRREATATAAVPTQKQKADKAAAHRAKDAARKRASREAKRIAEGLTKRSVGRPKRSIW